MKNGPCGPQFVSAYRCFLDSAEVLAAAAAVFFPLHLRRHSIRFSASTIFLTHHRPPLLLLTLLQELRGSDCVAQFKEMQACPPLLNRSIVNPSLIASRPPPRRPA